MCLKAGLGGSRANRNVKKGVQWANTFGFRRLCAGLESTKYAIQRMHKMRKQASRNTKYNIIKYTNV